ncbi:MAG: hypothetical protein ACREK6_02995 [Candidatus Rokuibacteriota bacterium]
MRTRNLCVAVFTLLVVVTGHISSQAAPARAYPTTGTVALFLDGAIAGFVQAVGGGAIVADAISEPRTPGAFPKKHPSRARLEPLHLQILSTASKPFFQWLSAALAGTPQVKTGVLVTYDAVLKEQERRTFTNLRLLEIGFPAFDASSKEPASLAVVAQAEAVVITPGGGQSVPKAAMPRPALASNFRLTLAGLDTARVSKVSPITVKLSPQGEISNLSVELAEPAADWRKWHEAFVVRGQGTDANEKSGTLDLLTADLTTTMLRLRLDGVGILRLEPTTGVDKLSRLKAELYAESVRVELP